MSAQVLVVAKAPVPGRVKTRLGAEIGMQAAAELAAAALLDTLAACTKGYGAAQCHLALAGDLSAAVQGDALAEASSGWSVFAQRGAGFAERLVHAHADVAARAQGAVLQIGMDTPQVTPAALAAVEADLGAPGGASGCDAVLGPAGDGGWWVLALHDPLAASALRTVRMSTRSTYDDTVAALQSTGLRVRLTAQLRDVDTVADARAVAAIAPSSRFAGAWTALRSTD